MDSLQKWSAKYFEDERRENLELETEQKAWWHSGSKYFVAKQHTHLTEKSKLSHF